MKSNASIQSIAAAHFPATKAIVPIYKIIMSISGKLSVNFVSYQGVWLLLNQKQLQDQQQL